MWPHGLSKIQSARSPYYLVSYVGKEYQKMGKFPKGMRVFAVWLNCVSVPLWVMAKFKLSALPRWLAEEITGLGILGLFMPKRDIGGGGWTLQLPSNLHKIFGADIWFPSPWVVIE
jgi:hypothetical protein